MYRAILPNLFTIGNLFCGFLAIHYILQGNFGSAAWLIVLGGVLDKMDGLIARFMGKDSRFGVEFDSLVDICTFGVAPALVFYLSYPNSGWSLIIAFVYLLCGALRLARFNAFSLDHEKGDYYLGLPIPVAAICLTQFVVFSADSWIGGHTARLAAPLVLLLSLIMVSRFEYDPIPNFRASGLGGRLRQIYFLVSVTCMIIPSTQGIFFILITIYVLSGVYRSIVGLFSDEVTQHA